MAVGEGLSLSGLDDEEVHPGLLGTEIASREPCLLMSREPVLCRRVTNGEEVLLREAHGTRSYPGRTPQPTGTQKPVR